MQIYNLSHPIEQNMPYFPSSEPPVIEQNATIEKNGYAEKIITFHTHTGTHIDAPGHIIPNGKNLSDFQVSKFTGKGLVVDIEEHNFGEISVEIFENYSDEISDVDFVLIHIGWSKKWGNKDYFDNFPVLSQEAAEWLTRFKLKGVGVDVISVDTIDSSTLPVHNILLKNDLVIIENLTNLNMLVNKDFTFFCLPLPVKEAGGSPVRAVAVVQD